MAEEIRVGDRVRCISDRCRITSMRGCLIGEEYTVSMADYESGFLDFEDLPSVHIYADMGDFVLAKRGKRYEDEEI